MIYDYKKYGAVKYAINIVLRSFVAHTGYLNYQQIRIVFKYVDSWTFLKTKMFPRRRFLNTRSSLTVFMYYLNSSSSSTSSISSSSIAEIIFVLLLLCCLRNWLQ
jgi:hypothetical protein